LVTSTLRRRALLLAASCLAACVSVALAGEPSPPTGRADRPIGRSGATVEELQRRAAACERRGDWLEACRCYDELLHRQRGQSQAKSAYLRCLRRHQLVRRHQDPTYQQVLTRLTPGQALDVYEQVLATIAEKYVDRPKVDWTALFQEGLRELKIALDEPLIVREYLSDVSVGVVSALQARLDELRDRKLAGRGDARPQVLLVFEAAQEAGLQLRPLLMTVMALEFAAGACYALDEWTAFLPPGGTADAQALRNRLPSIGVELALVDGDVVFSRVYRHGPAFLAGAMPQDRVLGIDGNDVKSLSVEAVAERLRGEDGSAVVVEVVTPGQPESRRLLKLVRRAMIAPTVDLLPPIKAELDGATILIGMFRIVSFQENTLHEVREALATLQSADVNVKALILDLRGNPGGLFKVSVQVAELFLGQGVIVIAQGPHTELRGPFKANITNPVTLPLVVLIDGDTASAAEVLAGALKEHRRATVLVGATTYGKGSIQITVPLDKPPLDRMPAAVRITVARLLSPDREPYSGIGIVPDVACAMDEAALLELAKQWALNLLRPMSDMMPMGPL
jgi:carboxyl-terminal processing protease